MRRLNGKFDAWRLRNDPCSWGWDGDETCGAFSIAFRTSQLAGIIGGRVYQQVVVLRVISSTGEGWDHVSVSLRDRCPTWDELEHVKRLFFRDDEVAMQLHVPPSQHVNVHPYCLHLWRPNDGREIPLPPSIMVG